MTKGLFDDESSSDEGIGSDGEGVEVKAPVLADRRKTKKTRRKEAEKKTEVHSNIHCTLYYKMYILIKNVVLCKLMPNPIKF